MTHTASIHMALAKGNHMVKSDITGAKGHSKKGNEIFGPPVIDSIMLWFQSWEMMREKTVEFPDPNLKRKIIKIVLVLPLKASWGTIFGQF